ncbi:MAG: Efflux transporter, family, subunit [Pedosphaera sp.]|nr:Efflux transporter, family, subunit [Pedosphaera sp.]
MANPKSKKRKKLIFFLILLLVVGGLTVVAIVKKKDVVITIQKEKAVRRNLTELVVANGKIQPVVQVKISPEVSGEILELPFKEGTLVKKGELLVSIRPDNYVATRDSSRANYNYSMANSNTAYANFEKADLEYRRSQVLFKTRLISDSDFLTAKTSFDVAKASLEGAIEQVGMAHASLQNAESDLSKTKIFSPLDGKITKLGSQVGERVVGTAMMAGTEIMTVSDLNEMEARVDIGEIDVVLIAVGQKVRLEVDAFKDRKFEGVVTDIANSAKNNDTGTAAASSTASQEATKFQVKIRIKEKEMFLPGMSVTAEIETRSRTNVITVPIQSVTTRLPKEMDKGKAGSTNAVEIAAASNSPATTNSGDSGSSSRKKADEPPKLIEVVFALDGDHVKMVPVKRGIGDENFYEIVEGLNEGADVVTGPYKSLSHELEEGTKVVVGVAKKEAAVKAN